MRDKKVSYEETNTIRFWEGLIDPAKIMSNYPTELELLKEGRFKELDLEKLKDHQVYSIRVNRSNRLLFSTIKENGQSYLLFLEEVLEHDYDKARFLKSGVLKNYLELNGTVFSRLIQDGDFEKLDTLPTALSTSLKTSSGNVSWSPVRYFNHKFLTLDELQERTLKEHLPLFVQGAPGSGKTCIALLLLEQHVLTTKTNNYPIIYVTESEALAEQMANDWQSRPIAQGLSPKSGPG